MSKQNGRSSEIADFLDAKSRQLLSDIDAAENQIDEFIVIMHDRFKQSSEHGYAVTLSKMFELKTDLFTKRTNILKMLSQDRGIDAAASKGTIGAFQFNDILSGQSLSGIVSQGMPQSILPGFYEPSEAPPPTDPPTLTVLIEEEDKSNFDTVDTEEIPDFESESLNSTDILKSVTEIMNNGSTAKN